MLNQPFSQPVYKISFNMWLPINPKFTHNKFYRSKLKPKINFTLLNREAIPYSYKYLHKLSQDTAVKARPSVAPSLRKEFFDSLLIQSSLKWSINLDNQGSSNISVGA